MIPMLNRFLPNFASISTTCSRRLRSSTTPTSPASAWLPWARARATSTSTRWRSTCSIRPSGSPQVRVTTTSSVPFGSILQPASPLVPPSDTRSDTPSSIRSIVTRCSTVLPTTSPQASAMATMDRTVATASGNSVPSGSLIRTIPSSTSATVGTTYGPSTAIVISKTNGCATPPTGSSATGPRSTATRP